MEVGQARGELAPINLRANPMGVEYIFDGTGLAVQYISY